MSQTQICETGQVDGWHDFCILLNSISAISERWDGDNGDNVQWNSIYTGFHKKNFASNRIRTQARRREDTMMWIWVK